MDPSRMQTVNTRRLVNELLPEPDTREAALRELVRRGRDAADEIGRVLLDPSTHVTHYGLLAGVLVNQGLDGFRMVLEMAPARGHEAEAHWNFTARQFFDPNRCTKHSLAEVTVALVDDLLEDHARFAALNPSDQPTTEEFGRFPTLTSFALERVEHTAPVLTDKLDDPQYRADAEMVLATLAVTPRNEAEDFCTALIQAALQNKLSKEVMKVLQETADVYIGTRILLACLYSEELQAEAEALLVKRSVGDFRERGTDILDKTLCSIDDVSNPALLRVFEAWGNDAIDLLIHMAVHNKKLEKVRAILTALAPKSTQRMLSTRREQPRNRTAIDRLLIGQAELPASLLVEDLARWEADPEFQNLLNADQLGASDFLPHLQEPSQRGAATWILLQMGAEGHASLAAHIEGSGNSEVSAELADSVLELGAFTLQAVVETATNSALQPLVRSTFLAVANENLARLAGLCDEAHPPKKSRKKGRKKGAKTEGTNATSVLSSVLSDQACQPSFDQLLALLGHGSLAEVAKGKLLESHREAFEEEMVRRMGSDQAEHRSAASAVLREIGTSMAPRVTPLLSVDSPAKRTDVVRLLCRLGERDTLSALAERIPTDTSWQVRSAYAKAAKEIRGSKDRLLCVPALLTLVDDDDDRVAIAALKTITDYGRDASSIAAQLDEARPDFAQPRATALEEAREAVSS